MRVLYKNLKGALTGKGFQKKNGRRVQESDIGYTEGPLHLLVDAGAQRILSLTRAPVSAEREVDCSELVASPGIVDSHTHALFGGSRWDEFFLRWSGADYAAINAAGGGIRKTFRDTQQCSDDDLVSKLLKDLKDMRASGLRLVEIKSGYGLTIQDEIRLLHLLKRIRPMSPLKMKTTFLGLHALPQGIDEESWTKEACEALSVLHSEALADYVDSFPEKGFFSLNSAETFFRRAMNLGIQIKVHADEITSMGASELGLRMGALSIDHLQKISAEALGQLATSKTVATLLPATSFYLGIEYAPARKILDSGARVALATDYNPGTAPHNSWKLTSLLAASQLKMTPAEIFCALTYNGASALGEESNYGILSEGYSSEVLFWNTRSQTVLEEILLSDLLPTTQP